VKLTDFGIAQSTDDPHLTTSGILVGSPVYMAPERLRGEDADAGSDLWSLGAVLFFAVEGYAAFERSSTAATMHAILNEVPYLTRCQGPLAAVVTGLLNTHPEARPSAAQVRGLLAQAAGTPPEGVTAPVGATTYQAAPPRRRWTRTAVTLVAVLALVLLTGGYFLRIATEPSPEVPADMDPTRTYGPGGYLAEISWTSDPAGGCFNSELAEGRYITQSAHIECDEPHNFEVFETRTFFARPDEYSDSKLDIDYPGEAGLTGYAENICTMIFGSKKISDDSNLRYQALVPTRRQWEGTGSRDVICVLYKDRGDQLNESRVAVE
jgi:hypothetical protein